MGKIRTSKMLHGIQRLFAIGLVLLIFLNFFPCAVDAMTLLCGKDEHQHTSACYIPEIQKELTCHPMDFVHRHDGRCYDESGNLICAYSDFILHKHDDFCYAEGCNLSEIGTFSHEIGSAGLQGKDCVWVDYRRHLHNDSCYEVITTLICDILTQVHMHDKFCYEQVLICSDQQGLEQECLGNAKNEASPDCSEEDKAGMSNSSADKDAHVHEESCYESRLICDKTSSPHEHTDACFEKSTTISCDYGQKSNLCHHFRYEEHTHDNLCFDAFGDIVCGLVELGVHQHTELCLSETILGTGLACETEEHMHTSSCYFEEDDSYDPGGDTGDALPDDSDADNDEVLGDNPFYPDLPVLPEVDPPVDDDILPGDDGGIPNDHISVTRTINFIEDFSYVSENPGDYLLGRDIYIPDINTTSNGVVLQICSDSSLDLQGHLITFGASSGGAFCRVSNGAKFEVYDSIGSVNSHTTPLAASDSNAWTQCGRYNAFARHFTYYTTDSKVTDKIYTQEQINEHSVDLTDLGGIIFLSGGSGDVFVVEQGHLVITNGQFTNLNGDNTIAASGSKIEINGGYLIGNSIGSAIFAEKRSSVSMTGGIIGGNTSQQGGGIYCQDSCFNMSGGVISGNISHGIGGGGVCLNGTTSVGKFTGGQITNNWCDGSGSSGGGIFIRNGASGTLDGSLQVTGNTADAGGGVCVSDATSFIMHNGIIAHNLARYNEGGGVWLSAGKNCYLFDGGHITNNATETQFDWGGGGLFISATGKDTTIVQILSALVCGNSAEGFGGGLAGCSTGHVYSIQDPHSGLALFDNHANGVALASSHSSKHEDQIAKDNSIFMESGYQDYFCALQSIISGDMLGGGSHGYRGSSNFKPVTIKAGEIKESRYMMGLTAYPNEDSKKQSLETAKLFITGNHSSVHGGGILCNGVALFGRENRFEAPVGVQVEFAKAYQDANGPLEIKAGEFEFTILRDFEVQTDNGIKHASEFSYPYSSVSSLDPAFSYDTEDVVAVSSTDSSGNVLFDVPLFLEDAHTGWNGQDLFIDYYLIETSRGLSAMVYDDTVYKLQFKILSKLVTKPMEDGNNFQVEMSWINWRGVTDLTYGRDVSTNADNNEGYGTESHRAILEFELHGEDYAFLNSVRDIDKLLSLGINKINQETREPLYGVEFILRDLGSDTTVYGTTGSQFGGIGYLEFYLEIGHSYELSEIPLDGYSPAGPWTITVHEDASLQIIDSDMNELPVDFIEHGYSCEILNTPQSSLLGTVLPGTGGSGIYWIYAVGFVLLLLGIAKISMFTKRK